MTKGEFENKKRTALSFIVAGVVLFILAMIVYLVFNEVDTENRQLKSLPYIVSLLYSKLGTMASTLLFTAFGIICFIIGINRRNKLKQK